MMVLVIPDAARLVKAADPDNRAFRGLPTDLKALEIAFVVGQQVLAEDLERVALQAEEDVGRDLFRVDVGLIEVDVPGAGDFGAPEHEQLALRIAGKCGARCHGQQYRGGKPGNLHARPFGRKQVRIRHWRAPAHGLLIYRRRRSRHSG